MTEEISPEKAKEIVDMLTGGGSIEAINTSLALGILPLVESIGDHQLLDRLVEHAQKVAEDDIEKGWARFEFLKRNSGSIDDIAELAYHAESLENGAPLAAAVLHHHALMLLSIDDTESAQTSVRRSLTLRESIEDKEGIDLLLSRRGREASRDIFNLVAESTAVVAPRCGHRRHRECVACVLLEDVLEVSDMRRLGVLGCETGGRQRQVPAHIS